ncbi:DUF1874 domain-containing protein [Candidatus Saccharibacteria bacterium]|nr:DUF1874 domain-containing protein [Candidatus Saccharibacteria bacterium]
MLDLSGATTVDIVPVTKEEVAASGFESVVGHLDTANVLTTLLGVEVQQQRVSVRLESPEDVLYVAQVTGGRLPEGATTLPAGIELKFLKVSLRG